MTAPQQLNPAHRDSRHRKASRKRGLATASICLAVATAGLAAATLSASSATAAIAPATTSGNGDLVYSGADGRLYTSPVANSSELGHTPLNVNANFPKIAPDGWRVLYLSKTSNAIQLSNVDGTDTRTVATVPSGISFVSPIWSPDGTKIAYLTQTGSQSTAVLRILDLTTGQTTAGASADVGPLTWSPDGKKIAWVHHVPPTVAVDGCNDFSQFCSLYAYNDEVVATLISNPTDFSELKQVRGWNMKGIAWNPSQQDELAVFTERVTTSTGRGSPTPIPIDQFTHIGNSLCVEYVIATVHACRTEVLPGSNTLAWSPDGQQIASTNGQDVQVFGQDIVNVEPRQLKHYSVNTVPAYGLDWAPRTTGPKPLLPGAMKVTRRDSVTGAWTATQPATNGTGARAVAVSASGRSSVVIDNGNKVEFQSRIQNPYPSYQVLDGPDGTASMQALRASVDDDGFGNTQVLAIGLDHKLWHRMRGLSGAWTPWAQANPGFRAQDAAIAIDDDGSAEVVATDMAGTLWHRLRGRSGSWTPFGQPPGGYGAGAVLAVAATAHNSPGYSHFAIITANDAYYTRRNTNSGAWDSWDALGSSVWLRPTLAAIAILSTSTSDVQFAATDGLTAVLGHQMRPTTAQWVSRFRAVPGDVNPVTSVAISEDNDPGVSPGSAAFTVVTPQPYILGLG